MDMLVLHYTGMKSAREALERLCNPKSRVSSHYLVDEDGAIYQLVAEKERAWHAGVSFWRGNRNINHRSIGIEIVNKGHEFGYSPFPQAQMEAVAILCRDILTRHAIPARNVVGHSDIAPGRKQDPGELFDWKFLAEKNIGRFPGKIDLRSTATQAAPLTATNSLSSYGYDTGDLQQAIIAFRRHFRPDNLSGGWDDECGRILSSLMKEEGIADNGK